MPEMVCKIEMWMRTSHATAALEVSLDGINWRAAYTVPGSVPGCDCVVCEAERAAERHMEANAAMMQQIYLESDKAAEDCEPVDRTSLEHGGYKHYERGSPPVVTNLKDFAEAEQKTWRERKPQL